MSLENSELNMYIFHFPLFFLTKMITTVFKEYFYYLTKF